MGESTIISHSADTLFLFFFFLSFPPFLETVSASTSGEESLSV